MDKRLTMDLVILITISQNKKVSTEDFHHLFEHEWEHYHARFDEMSSEGLYNIVFPIPGVAVSIYELTEKGKTLLTELLEVREKDVSNWLAKLKQANAGTRPAWKSVLAQLNSLGHAPETSTKITNRAAQSDYMRFKTWLHARLGSKQTVKG